MNKKQFRIVINAWLIVAVALLLPKPGYSQRLLFGVKIGGQITNTFTIPAPNIVHEDRVLLGPMLEGRVAHGFTLELDALYKPKFSYSNTFIHISPSGFSINQATDVSAHSWEIPLLLKWRLPVEHNRIFVSAGFSGRNIAGTTHRFGTQGSIFFPPPAIFDTRTSDGDIVNHWTYGPVVAAGVHIRARKFHFQPELRYTRWNTAPFPYGMRLDNVQVLIGIAVGKKSQ